MTVLVALQSLSNYPVPAQFLQTVSVERGIKLDDSFDTELAKTRAYRLLKSDVYEFLSKAPNISENGVSFSLSDKDKANFASKAKALRGEESAFGRVRYL